MTTTATKKTASSPTPTPTTANKTQKSQHRPNQRLVLSPKALKVSTRRRFQQRDRRRRNRMDPTTPSTIQQHRSSNTTPLAETTGPFSSPLYVERSESMNTSVESRQRFFTQRDLEASRRQHEHNQLGKEYKQRRYDRYLLQEQLDAEQFEMEMKNYLETEKLTAQRHREENQHLEKMDRDRLQSSHGQEENEEAADPPNTTSIQSTEPLRLLHGTAPASSSFVSGNALKWSATPNSGFGQGVPSFGPRASTFQTTDAFANHTPHGLSLQPAPASSVQVPRFGTQSGATPVSSHLEMKPVYVFGEARPGPSFHQSGWQSGTPAPVQGGAYSARDDGPKPTDICKSGGVTVGSKTNFVAK